MAWCSQASTGLILLSCCSDSGIVTNVTSYNNNVSAELYGYVFPLWCYQKPGIKGVGVLIWESMTSYRIISLKFAVLNRSLLWNIPHFHKTASTGVVKISILIKRKMLRKYLNTKIKYIVFGDLQISLDCVVSENVIRWMPPGIIDNKLTLVQVMAWCSQASTGLILLSCCSDFDKGIVTNVSPYHNVAAKLYGYVFPLWCYQIPV